MYQVRRVHIGKSAQLDELAHACGELYSKTLVFFWRTVRHKGKWLKAKHLMRLFTSPKLHAHTSDACVQAFFAALKSWRELREIDPKAKAPHKRNRSRAACFIAPTVAGPIIGMGLAASTSGKSIERNSVSLS